MHPLSQIVLSEDKYLNCTHCGLCLAVCPTYRESLNEISSPRGRVALARKGLQQELTLSANLYAQMYACFDCLACSQVCPVGIRPADLALEMRQMQEQTQPKLWKNILFSRLLSQQKKLEPAVWPMRLYRQTENVLGGQPRDLAAMLPPLPQRTARQALPEITPAKRTNHYKVGFFLGCAQNLLFASQSIAVVRVLSANQCTVFTPQNMACCGMPARGYGRTDLLLDYARHNIAQFEEADLDAIVTDCATCGAVLKKYGEILEGAPQWAERAAEFSRKVQDISEFLCSIPLTKPETRLDTRVTYHDPCHLRRGQGIWEQPRQLLKMINGLDLFEMPEADWCCGSAGSQLITHYETSLQVLDRKMDNLASTQAEIIASGCPGCQMQLNVGVNRRSLSVQVTHPIQLLDQAYAAGESP